MLSFRPDLLIVILLVGIGVGAGVGADGCHTACWFSHTTGRSASRGVWHSYPVVGNRQPVAGAQGLHSPEAESGSGRVGRR